MAKGVDVVIAMGKPKGKPMFSEGMGKGPMGKPEAETEVEDDQEEDDGEELSIVKDFISAVQANDATAALDALKMLGVC